MDADARLAWRRIKRQLAFWRVAAIAGVVIAIVFAVMPLSGVMTDEHIARLRIEGVITEDATRALAIQAAANDPSVKAVLVHIDSPGGTAYGGEGLFHNLRRVAAQKPVVAIMGTVATSAAYMTALGTDRIFARESTVTGSIGVILQGANIEALLEKVGVTPFVVKSAPLKAVPSPVEPFSPEAREAVVAVVMDMYQTFVSMVVERRAMEADTAENLADGRVFTGRQALDAGLIDGIGDEVDARHWLEEEHGIAMSTSVQDLEIDDPKDRLARFLTNVFGKTVFPEWVRLDGILSVWQLGK
jgi:protease-4